ncbi:uncharacterized protein LOC108098479 [Drosophila ficusphila]|uniref:uncharacterized protein LOC108098479 n=1 Tax=Drosophila ficusphila TaxID=30025 RepID=UPI0007E5DACF|nr:uncharacterized protein LOC108098479 [Drosophila ficusphila]
MRVFVMMCFLALARGQYDYTPVSQAGDGHGGLIGAPISGSAQLSEPIVPANEFTKEFYTYSAPEQEFDNSRSDDQIAGLLKKNLRVLFIKGPENKGLEQAALQLATSASDDRTAIYVLNKQADIGELASKLNQVKQQVSHKPEVHFVKYRTQSDAENAQRTIQAQYDLLPGASSNHNAGSTGPVLDFASKASLDGSAAGIDLGAPSTSSYLPPPHRRF